MAGAASGRGLNVARLRDLIRFERAQQLRFPVWLDRLISLGIVSGDVKVARRQKIVNVASFAAAFNSVSRVMASVAYEFEGAYLVQLVSGIMLVWALLIHRLHRYGDVAAALALTAWFIVSVSIAVIMFGLASQVQAYFVLAAVIWVLFDLERWRLSLGITVILAVIMLASINYGPQYGIAIADDPRAAAYLATQSMLNAVIINCVVIIYALLLLRRAEGDLERESARAEALIGVVLPEPIACRLRTEPDRQIADHIENVSILFADLAGFTEAAHERPPEEVVAYLNEFVRAFDTACEAHGVEKIKTIGDAYMAAGGIQGDSRAAASAVGRLALAMQQLQESRPPLGSRKLPLRVGIHTGTAIAGVIGDTRISYDLWGDAVNVASRMETHGVPGRIHVSDAFRRAAEDAFEFEARGTTPIKGIGSVPTYFLAKAR